MDCWLLQLELLIDGSCKFCKNVYKRKISRDTSLHIYVQRGCEIYHLAYTSTQAWPAKMWCCQKPIFYSDKWTCYAKHLPQWHRVLLCIALLRENECAARWWCGTAIRARYFAITMSTQFLLYILYAWLGCLAFWISWSLSATCAHEE